MWWPLIELDGHEPRIRSPRFQFKTVAIDIETLNQRSERAELDITAMSCATVRSCAGFLCPDGLRRERWRRIWTEACHWTFGFNAGDASRRCSSTTNRDSRHWRTTAVLVLNLLMGPSKYTPVVMPFETILGAVESGEVDAGVVIHEGQLTYEAEGLKLLVDLGAWWKERTGLPLPLGVNAMKCDLDLALRTGIFIPHR